MRLVLWGKGGFSVDKAKSQHSGMKNYEKKMDNIDKIQFSQKKTLYCFCYMYNNLISS
jgi:hypothetical protein